MMPLMKSKTFPPGQSSPLFPVKHGSDFICCSTLNVKTVYIICITDLNDTLEFLIVNTVVITYINCYSVNLATGVQNAFTAAKLVAVFVVVAGGAFKISQGRTEYFRDYFDNTTSSMGNVATAFYSGLWAYDGWNNLNYVTEEIKDPSK